MMTLDDAIKHAREKEKELGCTACGKEHRQLADWLEELKEYRLNDQRNSYGMYISGLA